MSQQKAFKTLFALMIQQNLLSIEALLLHNKCRPLSYLSKCRDHLSVNVVLAIYVDVWLQCKFSLLQTARLLSCQL